MNDNVKSIKQVLNERNISSLEQNMIEMRTQLHNGLQVIQTQQATLTSLLQRVQHLEQMNQLRKMNLVGVGPSVKE